MCNKSSDVNRKYLMRPTLHQSPKQNCGTLTYIDILKWDTGLELEELKTAMQDRTTLVIVVEIVVEVVIVMCLLCLIVHFRVLPPTSCSTALLIYHHHSRDKEWWKTLLYTTCKPHEWYCTQQEISLNYCHCVRFWDASTRDASLQDFSWLPDFFLRCFCTKKYRQKCIFRKFATTSGFFDNSVWHLWSTLHCSK